MRSHTRLLQHMIAPCPLGSNGCALAHVLPPGAHGTRPRLLHARPHALQIPTLESGEINYDLLKAALIANKDKPAVLNINIGTTVKGAVDDVDKILDVLKV